MLWVIIERALQLITLVMLVVMLAVIYQNSKIRSDTTDFTKMLEAYKQENSEVRAKNIELIERRHLILQDQQNTYQITMDKRMSTLENCMKRNCYSDTNNKK